MGGQRGAGHALQAQSRQVKRREARRLGLGATSAKLTNMAGLATFAGFVDELGLALCAVDRVADYVVVPEG